MTRYSVAQVANLPYRRLLIGAALGLRTASGLATLATRDTADKLSALRKARRSWDELQPRCCEGREPSLWRKELRQSHGTNPCFSTKHSSNTTR
jgi:hypothetical protein